jgi:hypothetical protein
MRQHQVVALAGRPVGEELGIAAVEVAVEVAVEIAQKNHFRRTWMKHQQTKCVRQLNR